MMVIHGWWLFNKTECGIAGVWSICDTEDLIGMVGRKIRATKDYRKVTCKRCNNKHRSSEDWESPPTTSGPTS